MSDYDVIVIGSGMAGINASLIAQGAGQKVAVVERDRVGGTCPIRGCIPTKALVRSAEIAHEIGRAAEFGIRVPSYEVDFKAVMDRVRGIIDRGSNGARGYLESLDGLDLHLGEGVMEGPDAVRVNGDLLRAPKVLLATGATPKHVPIPGLDAVDYMTSDDVLMLDELPPRWVVVGAGPIGLELGQALSRLGAEITIVEVQDRILPRAEPEVAEALAEYLGEEGITLMQGAEIVRADQEGALRRVTVRTAAGESTIEADAILLGVGRGPAVEELGLDAAGVEHSARGISVNDALETSAEGVYAAGDVLGAPYGAFTHTARKMGVQMAENALGMASHHVDPDWGPHAIFTDPEIAAIGLSEQQARDEGFDVSVGISRPSGGKARAWGEERGVVKVVTESGTRRILGAQILAYHGADLLHPIVVAMEAPGGTTDPIANAYHLHPTLGEVVKSAVEQAAAG